MAITLAAPAASASVAGFDLTLDPLSLGDSLPVFNSDFSRRWYAGAPLGIVVSNHGTLDSPAGATLTVSCDARVFRFTGVSGSFPDESTPEDLTVVSNTVDGNRSTITATVPYAIPAGTDPYTGFRVSMHFDTVAVYPDDAVQPVLDSTWVLGSPSGDIDPGNNTVSYAGYRDIGPATAWGVLAEATWERVEFAGGQGYSHRATTATLTSVGPTPAVAGGQIQILTDQRVSSAIAVDNILLNGEPAGDAIVFDRDDTYVGQVLYKYYTNTVDLVEGDVLTFGLSYTDGLPDTVPENLSGSQINFIGVIPADDNRRGMNVSSATNTDRTGFEATP